MSFNGQTRESNDHGGLLPWKAVAAAYTARTGRRCTPASAHKTYMDAMKKLRAVLAPPRRRPVKRAIAKPDRAR